MLSGKQNKNKDTKILGTKNKKGELKQIKTKRVINRSMRLKHLSGKIAEIVRIVKTGLVENSLKGFAGFCLVLIQKSIYCQFYLLNV